MTQEEQELLLKDLSARVPYDIMVEQTLFPPPLADKEQRLKSVQANNFVQLYWYKYINEFVPIHCIKPYLRPMSSMTEKEQRYIWDTYGPSPLVADFEDAGDVSELFGYCRMNISKAPSFTDWLNSHYFDYRGLIEKGLALEAPKDMYKD